MTTFTQEKQQTSTHDHDVNARTYIQAMLTGKKPTEMPEVGKWTYCCGILADTYDDAPESIEAVLNSLIKSKKIPGLQKLMSDQKKTGITQQNANARAYIKSLLTKEKPADMPEVGKWTHCCMVLEATYDPNTIANVVKMLIETKAYPGLETLLSHEQPEGEPLQGDAQTDDAPVVPLLDKNARTPLNFDLNSSEAYRLLLIYVEFSKKASPEGYEDFHMFCALWLLSVVVARRVYVWLAREKIYTNLRIALCAESTAYAKSVTAKVAISCAEEAELHHLLIRRGKITPEKLMANMAGKFIPADYNELDRDKQKRIDRRIAMAGQKGIYWDELGKFLKSMIKENSPMAKYQDLLLELDDCVTNGNDTVGRGTETIEKPYLPILGSLIPSTMKSSARAGSELWQDGNFARCCFICAPASGGTDAPLATGRMSAPSEIITALTDLNKWLGEAEIEITIDEKSGKPTIEVLRELPEYECTLSPEANKAQQAYRSALKQLCNSNKDVPADLKAGYIRLAATALRIAMLLASLEASRNQNQTTINVTLTHWRVAQELTEILRKNLHTFYTQVNGHKTHAARIEDDIMEIIKRLIKKAQTDKEKWFTPNDLRRYFNGRYSTKEIEDVLKSLKNTVLEFTQSTHASAGLYRLKEDDNQE